MMYVIYHTPSAFVVIIRNNVVLGNFYDNWMIFGSLSSTKFDVFELEIRRHRVSFVTKNFHAYKAWLWFMRFFTPPSHKSCHMMSVLQFWHFLEIFYSRISSCVSCRLAGGHARYSLMKWNRFQFWSIWGFWLWIRDYFRASLLA